MTVKIDGVEPNIFPHVHDLDARDAGRNVEMFLGPHAPDDALSCAVRTPIQI